MRGPESKLYQKLKKATPKIIWNRIENISVPGMPDVLGYNERKVFFTVELKVTRGNKLRFSPHQIAWHLQHPDNTFILAEALGPCTVKLYKGDKIKKLVACGLELEALAVGLEACCLELEACGLTLETLAL